MTKITNLLHIITELQIGSQAKCFQMLGIINRNFSDIDENTFLLLYKAMVRSHLEFAGSAWNPYKMSQIRSLEKIQKRIQNTEYLFELTRKLNRT